MDDHASIAEAAKTVRGYTLGQPDQKLPSIGWTRENRACCARVVYRDFDGNAIDVGDYQKFIEIRGKLYAVEDIINTARSYEPRQLDFLANRTHDAG